MNSALATGAGLGAFLGLGLILLMYWWESGRVTLARRINPYLSAKVVAENREPKAIKRVAVLVSGPIFYLVEVISNLLGLNAKALPQRLRLAGLRMEVSRFRQIQVIAVFIALTLATGLIAVASFTSSVSLPGTIVMTACFILVAVLAPNWWLGKKVRLRQQELDEQLPDFVELLALSVGAGQSLTVALERVSEACGGAIRQEIHLTLNRCQTGDSFASALRQLRNETESVPLQRLVDALVGATERGSSIAALLRDQALDTRRQARQQMMEEGGKAEVAMLVPVVFGILPLSVVFALYPGLIALQMSF